LYEFFATHGRQATAQAASLFMAAMPRPTMTSGQTDRMNAITTPAAIPRSDEIDAPNARRRMLRHHQIERETA